MSEQSEPKNHHFIPQFYQRGFIEGTDGLIWIYEKNRSPRRWTIRKTGAEIGFYGFTTSSGEFDIATVERDLGKLELKTAPLIKKLEAGSLLSDDERRLLSTFISVMWRRTPKEKEKVEKAAEKIIPESFEKIHAEIYQLVKEMAKSPEEAEILFEDKKKLLERLKENFEQRGTDFLFAFNVLRKSIFEDVLFSMDWAFFRSSQEVEFLTCDNPVAFNQGTGLRHRDSVIMFPLSKNLFLQAMWISKFQNNFARLSDFNLRHLNRCIVQNAYKQVYASRKSRVISSFVNRWVGNFERPFALNSEIDSHT